jgi:hypothetical protein
MSPADQATDVPLNAIMIARWDHAYTPTLELRDAMTHDVIPLVQEVRRPNSGPFGISLIGTPGAPLAASTTYELVAHDDSWTDTIATFTTGDAIDTTAPAFVGLAGLTLEVDWHLNFTTLYGIQSRVSTGVEYLLFEMVPLRAGYLYDGATDDHLVSVGAGFIVPYFGLDVGYQQSVYRDFETRTFACAVKFFITL